MHRSLVALACLSGLTLAACSLIEKLDLRDGLRTERVATKAENACYALSPDTVIQVMARIASEHGFPDVGVEPARSRLHARNGLVELAGEARFDGSCTRVSFAILDDHQFECPESEACRFAGASAANVALDLLIQLRTELGRYADHPSHVWPSDGWL